MKCVKNLPRRVVYYTYKQRVNFSFRQEKENFCINI